MRRKLKKLWHMAMEKARRMQGNKVWEVKLFGIQLFLIAQPDRWHTNIFICYIPFLRIDTEPTKFGINLLLLTWFYKAVYYLFTKWKFVKTEHEIQLQFCGINIYCEKDTVPYKFPTALFHG